MNDIEITSNVLLTIDEANVLHSMIVSGAKELKQNLLDMYHGEGYKVLGHEHWGDYLGVVSESAGIGRKALRRMHKSTLFLADAGRDIDEYREGTLRPLLDTLSDEKGYTAGHRERALELAEEFANGNQVTAKIAKSAAQYVAVMGYWGGETDQEIYGAGNAANLLASRMQNGEVSTEVAYQLMQLMDEDAHGSPTGMEWVIARVSDISLARYLINLRQYSAKAYEEIEEQIALSGTMPTVDGQVPIGAASYDDLVRYLDEPNKMKRYEKAVERSESYKSAAQKAANVAIKWYGIQTAVPENLVGTPEGDMYGALLECGLIRYGMKADD